MRSNSRAAWRVAQWLLVAIGGSVVALLLVLPRTGLILVWDVLIPAAPALLVFAPGLWRNICPLGTISQIPRRFERGGARRLSARATDLTAIGGATLLLVLVPLRHVGLDDTGAVSFALMAAAGLLAVACGARFLGKSGWCSGLCPVHPVERLYGLRPAMTFANAHCSTCVRCVDRCPDSTPRASPLRLSWGGLGSLREMVVVGGFPGFVWGWNQVGPGAGLTLARVLEAFAWTWGPMAVTAFAFALSHAALGGRGRAVLVRGFAAAAVSAYYWFKLPSLLGFGSGTVLLDLGAVAPGWAPWAIRLTVVVVFAGWLLWPGSERGSRAWLRRPEFDRSVSLAVIPRTHADG